MSVKKHKESKHQGIRYPCDECQYAAQTSYNLKRHKELKHSVIYMSGSPMLLQTDRDKIFRMDTTENYDNLDFKITYLLSDTSSLS